MPTYARSSTPRALFTVLFTCCSTRATGYVPANASTTSSCTALPCRSNIVLVNTVQVPSAALVPFNLLYRVRLLGCVGTGMLAAYRLCALRRFPSPALQGGLINRTTYHEPQTRKWLVVYVKRTIIAEIASAMPTSRRLLCCVQQQIDPACCGVGAQSKDSVVGHTEFGNHIETASFGYRQCGVPHATACHKTLMSDHSPYNICLTSGTTPLHTAEHGTFCYTNMHLILSIHTTILGLQSSYLSLVTPHATEGTMDRYAPELVSKILSCDDQQRLAVVVYQMWLYLLYC
jgi:hypothetical protein